MTDFNLDEAMERLERFQNGEDELVGQVAVDVRQVARSLGIDRNRDAVSEATKMALRCANRICDYVLEREQPDEQLLNTLRELAGDAFNELREREIASEARADAADATDAAGRPLAGRMQAQRYVAAVQQRRTAVKWARGTANYNAAAMRRQSEAAAVDEQNRAEARRIADETGGDARTRVARYSREYQRLRNDSGGGRLRSVALLGSQTPARPLPDLRL